MSLLPSLNPLIGPIQEALASSGQVLHEVSEVIHPQENKLSYWPHWTVIALGGNAAVTVINTVVQGILQNIAQAVVSGISAAASILGAITLYAFTPLQSLGGYVEQLTQRVSHMNDVVRRLHGASQQLRSTTEALQNQLQEEQRLAAQQKKSLEEATHKLTLNVQALQKAETQALSLEKLISTYSSQSAGWGKKFEEFMKASHEISTTHEELSSLVTTLKTDQAHLNTTVTFLDHENDELQGHTQQLAEASQQFRGIALQLATLLVDVRKERKYFEEKLTTLEKEQKALQHNTESLASTREKLQTTGTDMKQNLQGLEAAIKIGQALVDADKKRKQKET